MKQTDYLVRFKEVTEEMFQTTQAKNTDYAGPDEAFANFNLIESLSQKHISAAEGIVVRMSDKLQRITNLLQRDAKVNEKITDTLTDLAVYAIILRIMLEQQEKGDNFVF